MDFLVFCRSFNGRVRSMFREPIGCTAAADVYDRFYYIPVQSCSSNEQELRRYWEGVGVSRVRVPWRAGAMPGGLGAYKGSGFVVIDFDSIAEVLGHFADTNFVRLDNEIRRKIKGVPMSDPLRPAALRLF